MQFGDDVSPRPQSRRTFLTHAGRFSAGLLGVPSLLSLAGFSKQAVSAQPEDGFVLKASRFKKAPDGRPREIMGYNGEYPGPAIRIQEGKTLRVRVVNDLDVPTSVHWHGMHQPGTWTMDGVEDVSRPPIPAGKEFVYEFQATPAGTHWYHSHVGVQYGDGLLGPLIVEERTPIATYDREEVLMLNDWFLEPGDALLARLLKGMGRDKLPDKDKKPEKPDKMDMKGMKDLGDVPFQSALVNGKGHYPGAAESPLTVLEANKGETIRLRLINSSSTYALRFQIDGHPLKVIATDGAPIKPVEVDNLVLAVGERYDVLLKADGEGPAWIRAATLDGKEGKAILRYKSTTATPTAAPLKWGERMLMPEALRSPEPIRLAEKPRELQLLLGGSMKPFRWSINDQYYPKADPIVLQKDEPVRFTLKNPTGMDHPFHLHGHYFSVLGKPGALNLKDPVSKDTVNIPARGELVLQWVAKNPGRWFFHCHIEWHLAAGMARVIEIKPF